MGGWVSLQILREPLAHRHKREAPQEDQTKEPPHLQTLTIIQTLIQITKMLQIVLIMQLEDNLDQQMPLQDH